MAVMVSAIFPVRCCPCICSCKCSLIVKKKEISRTKKKKKKAKKKTYLGLERQIHLEPSVIFMSVVAHWMLGFGAMVVEGGGVVGQLGLWMNSTIGHVID